MRLPDSSRPAPSFPISSIPPSAGRPATRMPITIRRGEPADIDALTEISELSFDASFGEAWTAAQLSNIFSLPGAWVDLAVSNGEALSFALVRRILDEAELLLIAVRPNWRGRGVAAELMRNTFATSAGLGAVAMFLEVRAGNTAAVRLYKRLGFSPIGERRGYYTGAGGLQFDAITMRRTLGTTIE